MLEAAGLAVCTANAEDDVKKHADYVTEADNENGAVEEALRKFLL
jgi:hydroxymethylpyrimidine pyrophosphatase-like HAD family hydrolase